MKLSKRIQGIIFLVAAAFSTAQLSAKRFDLSSKYSFGQGHNAMCRIGVEAFAPLYSERGISTFAKEQGYNCDSLEDKRCLIGKHRKGLVKYSEKDRLGRPKNCLKNWLIMNKLAKKYVFTGGLCAGKSTTLWELEKRGFKVAEEATSTLVREAVAAGFQRPAKNTVEFQEFVFVKQKELELGICGTTFFDRSAVDILAFCRFHNIEFPKGLEEYVSQHKYDKVFFFEKLPFYEQCDTRCSPKGKYAGIELILKEEYKRLGYVVIGVPFMSVSKRIEFILKNIAEK